MDRTAVLQKIKQAADTNATELDLSSMGLTEIPEEITQLSNLAKLNLSYNQISVIPDSIAKLSNLLNLTLDNNQISVIPDSIAKLSKLSSLVVIHNRISVIPDSITKLSKLSILILDNNRISVIPDSITKLSKLSILILNNNQISIIPDSIVKLSNLSKLYLSDNHIKIIPNSISQLCNLTQLDLHNNQISVIPDSITQLSNLRYLILKGNPIVNVPPEIIDGAFPSIFPYLKSIQKSPLNELKVLLVGEGDVGKTSLLKSLLCKPFDDRELKTPGINIEQLQFPTQSEPVRLNLWDFGGQRVMHNTHQFFLTKRSLYLLVLDNRKNEQQNRIEYWLKLIETYGGDSPVIIIGNCADEHPFDLKQRTLRKKYPQIKQFIATSCKTGKGIPELRQLITDQIDQIPHVRDLLPASWFNIKTKLEAMQTTTDFISYEKYQDLCQLADITTTQD